MKAMNEMGQEFSLDTEDGKEEDQPRLKVDKTPQKTDLQLIMKLQENVSVVIKVFFYNSRVSRSPYS